MYSISVFFSVILVKFTETRVPVRGDNCSHMGNNCNGSQKCWDEVPVVTTYRLFNLKKSRVCLLVLTISGGVSTTLADRLQKRHQRCLSQSSGFLPVHVEGQITVSFCFLHWYFWMASTLLSLSSIVCMASGTSSFSSSSNTFSSALVAVVRVVKISAT